MFKIKKKKQIPVDEKRLHDAIQQELSEYLTKKDLDEYLEKIKHDERKRKVWESLSARKKIKVLRYVLKKRGGE